MGKKKNRDVIKNQTQEKTMSNSLLAEGLGLSPALGIFPGNQGSPYSAQISKADTIFKNMRWYLVSNFRQALSEAYVELGLIQAIVDIPVDDALRGGIKIKSKELSEEQLEKLYVSIDRDNDLTTIGQGAKWTRLFGGGGILVIVGDQDPEEPLDIDSIDADTDIEFRACDLWELLFTIQNGDSYDPSVQMQNYEYFNYYGQKVHKSRVILMQGITAPSFIRPRLRGWGFSVIERLVRSINQYLKATDLVFEVLDEFKIDIYKIKNLVNTLMSPGGANKVFDRVQTANLQKNYQHAVTMDSEDDYIQKQLSFTGLAETMAGIRMQIASDMRMPLSKIFGVGAAGFNSGEDDLEVYNGMVESEVRLPIKYPTLRLIEIKCQKHFGFVPTDLMISYEPLRLLTAEQEQNVKTQEFTRLMQAREIGEIDSKDFKEGCNRAELLPITLDITADDIGFDDEDGDLGQEDSGVPDATDKGGLPKGQTKPKDDARPPKDAPDAKDRPNRSLTNSDFKESEHPRDSDGEFTAGGGDGSQKDGKKKTRRLSKEIKATKDEKKIGMDFIFKTLDPGSVVKINNPVEHKIAERLVAAGDAEIVGKKNYGRIEAIKMKNSSMSYSALELDARKLMNSGRFDKASYKADGGEKWIDARRLGFFEKPLDAGLWIQAKDASSAALGEENQSFMVWWYMKHGGKFH